MNDNKKRKISGISIAGFVISLISLLFMFVFIPIFTLLGLFFSLIGLYSTIGLKERGLGFAIAGIAISGFSAFFMIVETFFPGL